jgi:hypothetical protein
VCRIEDFAVARYKSVDFLGVSCRSCVRGILSLMVGSVDFQGSCVNLKSCAYILVTRSKFA